MRARSASLRGSRPKAANPCLVRSPPANRPKSKFASLSPTAGT